jgi:alpha-L-rhamnosidase
MTIKITDMTCQGLVNPIGLISRDVSFCWKAQSHQKCLKQKKYQIRVFKIERNKNNHAESSLIRDTGWVDDDNSVDVFLLNNNMESFTYYTWQVRCEYSNEYVSEWSGLGRFGTGFLEPDGWKANWIEPEQENTHPDIVKSIGEIFGNNISTSNEDLKNFKKPKYIRKSFQLKNNKVSRAFLSVTAHGVYKYSVNGFSEENVVLAPGATAYDKYLEYQTYDISEMLESGGENVIGLIVADGWYAGHIGAPGANHQYGSSLKVFFQINIIYDDGTSDIVLSDASAKSSNGSYIYSDLFVGECYDSRISMDGWDKKGFNDQSWIPVKISADVDNAILVNEISEPVRRIKKVNPISITYDENSDYIVDFGQVLAGRVRCNLRGENGDTIVFEHSEILSDGKFVNNVLGRYKDQRDIFIHSGNGLEVYEPEFTFHGFRYVKISGYKGVIDFFDIVAVVLSSDLQHTSKLITGHPGINQLYSNIKWSQVGNLLSIPMDCPQRERAGWTGDIQVYSDTAAIVMNVKTFMQRWLNNMRVEQGLDGQVPVLIPFWKSYKVITDTVFGENNYSCAGWSDSCIILPWVIYQNSGDINIIKDNYSMMKSWLMFVEKKAANEFNFNVNEHPDKIAVHKYLWNTGFHYGDWFMPSCLDRETELEGAMACAFSTKEIVASAFFAYTTSLMIKISDICGQKRDSDYFSSLYENIKNSFSKEYINEDGRINPHFQGVYTLALKFDLVPERLKQKVINNLVSLIEMNHFRLDTGFLSMPFLLDVLCESNKQDIAYKLLFQTECPSWLYEVNHGATTIWENWSAIKSDGRVTNVSYNHYAFGCVGSWLFRHIMGIKIIEPGYKKFIIQPHPIRELGFSKSEIDTPYGTIRSSWKFDGNDIFYDFLIPVGTFANINLIDGSSYQLGSGTYQFKTSAS